MLDFLVYDTLVYDPVFDKALHLGGIPEPPSRHLYVKTVVDCIDCGVGGFPVGCHYALESPAVPQHIYVEVGVFCPVDTVHQSVAVHHHAHLRLLYTFLEGRKVDFVQGAFVHVRRHMMPVVFLVVGGEMLHAGHDTHILHAFDIGCGGLSRKIRVFSEVFEIAPAHR